MLDLLLAWGVVIMPTLFALTLEVIDERFRKNPKWKYGVIAFGVLLSGLTWWQQTRAIKAAERDRENAITDTSEKVSIRVSADVTAAVTKQYSQLVADQKTQIAQLQSQLTNQGKDLNTIKGSNIVTGKNPIKVEVMNPKGSGESVEPEIHVAKIPATPNPQFGKNVLAVILTTNQVMNGGRVKVTCTRGKINQGGQEISNVGVTMAGGSGGVLDDHTFVSDISSPNWSPGFPLFITLYYDSDDLGVCNFTPLK